VTVLAEGRVVLAEALDLWFGPRLSLWTRLGGRIKNGRCDQWSFVAEVEGPLELCIYQGEWASEAGDLATPVAGYAALTGGLDVLLLRWRGAAARGLRRLQRALPAATPLSLELARLAAPVVVPRGWHYHPLIGESEVFEGRELEDGVHIAVDARNDVGILQHPVSLPLREDSVLSWRWKLTALPSARPEDELPTHDYVSIAVQFDNGRDLTWLWSAGLAAEHCFHCPLPNWNARETHLVARSGAVGLGAWQTERRSVRADYARAIGEPPARIVGVWLIAVSLFQHGRAQAEFADVWLRDGHAEVRVL
jgi:hypothetical protein